MKRIFKRGSKTIEVYEFKGRLFIWTEPPFSRQVIETTRPRISHSGWEEVIDTTVASYHSNAIVPDGTYSIFEFFDNEHDLILLDTEIHDIIAVVEKYIETRNS